MSLGTYFNFFTINVYSSMCLFGRVVRDIHACVYQLWCKREALKVHLWSIYCDFSVILCVFLNISTGLLGSFAGLRFSFCECLVNFNIFCCQVKNKLFGHALHSKIEFHRSKLYAEYYLPDYIRVLTACEMAMTFAMMWP